MADQSRSEIIKCRPIGEGLNGFRDSFKSTYDCKGISSSFEALDQLGNEAGKKNLFSDLSRLNSAVNSGNFDIERIAPLLKAVVDNEPDQIVWDKVYDAVTESTPPPRSLPSIQQTPWLRNTSSFANSSEHRKYVDDVLKEELGSMYVGVPGFYEAFFGDVGGLEPAAKAVFKRCREGDNLLYCEGSGWRGWPEDAREKDVLGWFAQLNCQLMDFAEQ